jgi:hypothetical protein
MGLVLNMLSNPLVKTIIKRLQGLPKPLMIGMVAGLIIVGAGATAIATGNAGVLKHVPGLSGLIGSDKPGEDSAEQIGSSPSSSPTASPTASASPASSGAPTTSTERGAATTPTTKALVLSRTSFTLGVGQSSATFTAKSPDGHAICQPSGSVTGVGLTVQSNSTSRDCPLQHEIFLGGANKAGVYTVQIIADTKDKVSDGKYIRYTGYVKVTVSGTSTATPPTAPSPTYSLQLGGVHVQQVGGEVDVVLVQVDFVAAPGQPAVSPKPLTWNTNASCAEAQVMGAGPSSSQWYCVPANKAGHGSFSVTLYSEAGTPNQKSVTANFSY